MPPQVRTVETMTSGKCRLQAAADVLEGLGLVEDVHKPFTTDYIEAQANLFDDFSRGAAMRGAVDGAPRGKIVQSHRLWAVTELMKQTFGLRMTEVGTQRVRLADGDRTRSDFTDTIWSGPTLKVCRQYPPTCGVPWCKSVNIDSHLLGRCGVTVATVVTGAKGGWDGDTRRNPIKISVGRLSCRDGFYLK